MEEKVEIITRCTDIAVTARSAAGQIEGFTASMVRQTNPCATGSERNYDLPCSMHCGIIESLDIGGGDGADEAAILRQLPSAD